jgi:hypothetical protein
MILLVLCCSFFSFSIGELVSIHVITRHADRTPVFHLKAYESLGTVGLLTEQGMKRIRGLYYNIFYFIFLNLGVGYSIRSLYSGFLPKDFDPYNFYFYSTNYTRTIRSLKYYWKGLFDTEDENKIPNIIHTSGHCQEFRMLGGTSWYVLYRFLFFNLVEKVEILCYIWLYVVLNGGK